MENYAVLLDTSFIIRLLSESDGLHYNAVAYYKYFLEHGIDMKFSTDSKLLAQADLDPAIKYFVTSDVKAKNTISILNAESGARVQHLDIHTPVNIAFSELFG